MIIENTIVVGLGTAGVGFKESEPDVLYFVEHPLGEYKVGELTPNALEKGSKVKAKVIFDSVEAPLGILRTIKQTRDMKAPIVHLDKFDIDFSRAKVEETWDIVEEWFLSTAKRMAKARDIGKNDFSKIYCEVVGD